MLLTARVSPIRSALARVAVVCAAVGYLLAFGTTSAGQGWQLTPHLALDHAGAGPPALVEGVPATLVLQTLRHDDASRHTHAHEGYAAHRHGRAGGHAHLADAPRQPEVGAVAVHPGEHRHGDLVHHHQPPPPQPTAPVVTLDKHHPPAAQAVPAPLAARLEGERTDETRAARALTVETPPPVGRG